MRRLGPGGGSPGLVGNGGRGWIAVMRKVAPPSGSGSQDGVLRSAGVQWETPASKNAILFRLTRRHFNGMTGAELKQLRKDLGDAIGRPLSVNDFAKLCGLPSESGGGTILEWENGYGPIGPVAALLSLLAVGSDRYPIDEEIISESDAAFYRAMMRAGIIRRIG
jgi:transcriptional regulator with XRE-family HTH domain